MLCKKSTLKIITVLIVMLTLAGCVSSGNNSGGGSVSADTSDEEKVITGVTSSIEESGAVLINVEGNTTLTYTSLKQSLPLSIVLYFPGTSLEGVEEELASVGDIVSGIKTSQQNHESGSDSRVKILLNHDVDYEISKTTYGLELLLSSIGDNNQVAAEDTYDSDNALDEQDELSVNDDEVGSVEIEDNFENYAEETEDDVTTLDESDYNEDTNIDDEIVDDYSTNEELDIIEEETEEYIGSVVSTGPASKVISVSRKIINDYVEINIDGDGTIKDYDIFTIPQSNNKSARIVCDIKNIEGIKTKGEHIVLVNSNGVDKVRYFTYPDKMRIVIDVDQENIQKFKHNPVSSGLAISIGTLDGESTNIANAESTQENDGLDEVLEEDEPLQSEEVDDIPEVAAMDDSTDDAYENTDTLTETDEMDESSESYDEEISESYDEEGSDVSTISEDESQLADENETDSTVANEPESFSNAGEYTKPAWINKIDFLTGENGKSSIVIGASHPVEYKDKKKNGKTLHFRILNTTLPKSRKHPFITTHFESAVNRILPVQTSGMKNIALFIIELRESVPYFIDQQGSTITINFEASSVAAVSEDKSGLPEWQEVLNQTTEIADIEAEAAQGEEYQSPESTEDEMIADAIDMNTDDDDGAMTPTPSDRIDTSESIANVSESDDALEVDMGTEIDEPVKSTNSAQKGEEIDAVEDSSTSENETVLSGNTGYVSWAHKKKYKGEKISVDFYETDIKNILRIIRAVSGENFAVDKDVKGTATMTLDNPVPWDQVLDLVLKMNMLGMVSEGGINRVATLDTLQNEEEKRLQFIAAEEKTKRKQKALEPLETKYILINYADAESEIKPLVEKILTEERGNLSIDKRTNQVIITDTNEKIDEAIELIKKLDKITSQVIIEARIVEASTNFSRSLGTEWGLGSNKSYDTYNDALGGTYGWDVAMNNTVASNSSFGFNFTRLTGAQFLLNAKLLAMENKGEGKIISAPKLITLDNKKAEIKQGYSYPYRVYDDGAAKTNFVDIVLKLEVTPHVTSDRKIAMVINIDKDDVAEMTDDGPAIAKNNITTELLIDDGDTIVIGGVVKATQNKSMAGFPVLSKIPVIGWLFKSKSTSETKQELLIFLTPRIATFVGDL